MESPIHFFSAGLRIEGRLQIGGTRSVVITHPHPLYGGDMHNPVIEAIAAGYHRLGYTTLRFNFRGVGGSRGRYDEGRGEQDDVDQAAAYLRNEGYGPVELSGYSFGTWVNALYATRRCPDIPMTMVSPPVAFMDFREVRHLCGLTLAITGSRDDIAPSDMLRRILPRWHPGTRLEVVPGADHFFAAHLEVLTDLLGSTTTNTA